MCYLKRILIYLDCKKTVIGSLMSSDGRLIVTVFIDFIIVIGCLESKALVKEGVICLFLQFDFYRIFGRNLRTTPTIESLRTCLRWSLSYVIHFHKKGRKLGREGLSFNVSFFHFVSCFSCFCSFSS